MDEHKEQSLFRQSALLPSSSGALGEIEFSKPGLLTWCVGLFLIVSILFGSLLLLGEVGRTITLSGTLVPSGGVREVFSLRAGPVTSLGVEEGDRVEKGQLLLGIASYEMDAYGESISGNITSMLQDQIAHLERSIEILHIQENQETEQLQSEIVYLGKELRLLSLSADSALFSLGLEKQQADASARLYEQNAVSELALSRTVEELHQIRRGAYTAELTLLSHQKILEERRHELRQLPEKFEERKVNLQRQISQLHQTIQQYRAQRENGILAPVSGRVSSLLARAGDSVSAGKLIATITQAEGAEGLIAKLWVPSDAVVDLAVGDKVFLEVDSFPVEQHGRLEGKVTNISRMPSLQQLELTSVMNEPGYFEAEVEIVKTVGASNSMVKMEDLRPGLRITAQVELDRLSLLEHITGPLVRMYKDVL